MSMHNKRKRRPSKEIATQGPIKVQELAKLDKVKSKRKKSLKDLVDLVDARKKSISGSVDENPELKSKWEKVIPSMRRGSTSTVSRGSSWRKGKLGNDKLGKLGNDKL